MPHTASARDSSPHSVSRPRFAFIAVCLAAFANIGFFLPDLGDVGKQASAIPFSDKIVHVGIFALTAWALTRFITRVPSRCSPTPLFLSWRTIVGIVIALVAWAWAIEGIQSLMPARSADPADVLADSLGIVLGYVAWRGETALSQFWIKRQA